jgi:anti-sigma factor RsiW
VSSDTHLGDELSALLDGELTADEQAAVASHLATCDECRAELEATRTVRGRLRSAGAVDPPFGFYERLTRKRRRWPAVASAAAAVAIAAACVAIVGFAVQPGPATRTPPVDALRAVASGAQNPGGLSLHRAERNAVLPAQLAGLPRQSTFKAFVEGGDATVAVFGASPEQTIVAYVVRGDADWSQLQGGIRSPVQGLPGNPWQSNDSTKLPAIVVQSGDFTVMVTGTVPPATLAQAAKEIVGTASEPSAVDRLRDAAGSVVDAFMLH